jgi:hypothetical protein
MKHKHNDIFDEYQPLSCLQCGKDLFLSPKTSSIVYLKNTKNVRITDIFWTCGGECEETYKSQYEQISFKETKEKLSDLMIPSNYLSWVLANMDVTKSQWSVYENNSYQNLRHLILRLAQYVFRNHTLEEIRNFNNKKEK